MNLFFCQFYRRPVNYKQPKPKEPDPMKTDTQQVFLQIVSVALRQLKQRLQQDYEQAYPDLREIIHLVLDEEETEAWELSLFPHLLLPDLVEAHIEKLNLRSVNMRHDELLVPHPFPEIGNHQRA